MSHPQHHPYYDRHGRRIPLGKKIGSGGEGDVFDIGTTKKYVAKIYHKPLDAEKQEKLRLMVHGSNKDLKEISAWPLDVILDGRDGPVCGFIMPRVSDFEPVHKVYGPTHRKLLFPTADWKFLIRTAKNLAAAFDVMHYYGYVIGDVNEGNILVNNHACVTLIDCDSVQVRTNGTIYFCEVGVAQFTPPEIQSSKNFHMERSANHDNFGLAILIFQLLFMGRHPYSGVYSRKDDMPLERAIGEYRFAFGKNAAQKFMSPPPNSVGLSIVPGEIAELFETAFTETGVRGRPTAGDWWAALDNLERRLKQCNADSAHKFFTGLVSCPWCRLEYESGVFLFLSPDAISKFDLNAEWYKIQSVIPPGPLPVIQPRNYPAQPKPLEPAIKKALSLWKVRLVAGGLFAIWAVGLVALGSLDSDSWLIALCAFAAVILFLFPGKELKEKQRRTRNFESAKYNWELVSKKWNAEAGDERFRTHLDLLLKNKLAYEALEREYKQALVSLQGSAKDRQLQSFLENCFIDSYNFLRITANRKATLRSFGIETAADISEAGLRRIPEFNDVLRNELLDWKKLMEEKFRFNPSKSMDPSGVQALIHKFQPRMRPIERELRLGIETLHEIQQKTLKARTRFQPMVEKSARDLAQAQADMEVF